MPRPGLLQLACFSSDGARPSSRRRSARSRGRLEAAGCAMCRCAEALKLHANLNQLAWRPPNSQQPRNELQTHGRASSSSLRSIQIHQAQYMHHTNITSSRQIFRRPLNQIQNSTSYCMILNKLVTRSTTNNQSDGWTRTNEATNPGSIGSSSFTAEIQSPKDTCT